MVQYELMIGGNNNNKNNVHDLFLPKFCLEQQLFVIIERPMKLKPALTRFVIQICNKEKATQ